MRIHPTFVEGFELGEGEAAFLPAIREELARLPAGTATVVDSPAEADVVWVIESGRYKCHRHGAILMDQPWMRRPTAPVVSLNYEDNPAGYLPGLYASLPSPRFIPDFHVGFCYGFPPALPAAPGLEGGGGQSVDRLLFSFRGAFSHPLRRALVEEFGARSGPWSVRAVERWYNHTEAERLSYLEELLASDFVLCPRGIGTGTHRLFEVMARGRCPVVLSDEWVPPEGVDWDSCSIRVPEAELTKLPELLAARCHEAAVLGERAKAVWAARFAPATRWGHAVELMRRLVATGLPDPRRNPALFLPRWKSRAFKRANGWLLSQRIRRRIGRLMKRT